MTSSHLSVDILRDKLIELLHPEHRDLMRNAQVSNHLRALVLQPGIFSVESNDIHNCIGVVLKGVIGVKHDFEGVDAITHFYQRGDLLMSTEIDENYDRQGSFWHIYEETELVLLPLFNEQWQNEYAALSRALSIQASLMAAFVYQKHINNLGIDRKYYSVQWLREHRRLLSIVPRMDLANYLDISKSSLKSFIRIALSNG